jgi:hypothetical protein
VFISNSFALTLSPGSILFPFPTDPSHAATFWNDPPSGSSEAGRRANLEEAGHENNMLQEGNDLTMKLDTEKCESQRRNCPLTVVDILIYKDCINSGYGR